ESGGLSLAEAFSLQEIEQALQDWRDGQELTAPCFVPMERLELGLPKLELRDSALAQRLRFGQNLRLSSESFDYDWIIDDRHHKAKDGLSSSSVLLQEQGSAFGLGFAKWLSSDCVQVVMK